MPTQRVPYQELPSVVREKVEAATGTVLDAESSEAGLNSAVAAKLRTAAGSYFVKAIRADHPWAWTQRREADVAPYVRAVAPELVARVEISGWDTLVFEAIEGHHADYSPGSSDLPFVADLLCRIGELPPPGIELREAAQRLASYVSDEDDLRYFRGESLLHTDWNNTNVLVGEPARIVDWGWATRGASWLDPGYWALWLIAAGHDPQAAESWALQVPAWRVAPPRGVTAFAEANARLWAEIGADRPDPWTQRLVNAAASWHRFRKGP